MGNKWQSSIALRFYFIYSNSRVFLLHEGCIMQGKETIGNSQDFYSSTCCICYNSSLFLLFVCFQCWGLNPRSKKKTHQGVGDGSVIKSVAFASVKHLGLLTCASVVPVALLFGTTSAPTVCELRLTARYVGTPHLMCVTRSRSAYV